MSTGNAAHAEFAVRFRLSLEEAGYGKYQLKELGKLFGVSATAVRKWLDGESMPVSKRAPAVAHILGVRRAWLLDGELPMRPHPAALDAAAEVANPYSREEAELSISGEEFRLLNNYRKLPRAMQHAFGKLLEESTVYSGKQ